MVADRQVLVLVVCEQIMLISLHKPPPSCEDTTVEMAAGRNKEGKDDMIV